MVVGYFEMSLHRRDEVLQSMSGDAGKHSSGLVLCNISFLVTFFLKDFIVIYIQMFLLQL